MNRFRLHGANPEKLYGAFDIPMPSDISDFSTNINAVEWDGRMEFDMKKTLCNYPDDEAAGVRSIAAAQNGCNGDEVLVTSGTNEAIYLIASYQQERENRILQPAYGEYLRALESYGVRSENIRSLSGIDGKAGTIWICNPCNPTGVFIPDREMEEIFRKFPDKLFVIDEAYKDFMFMEQSRLNFRNFNNVILLRSLTKIYNLCGARIGYVLAHRDLISKLKLRQPTWSVNSPAQQAAAAFLNDPDFAEKTRGYYREEIPRFIENLRAAGYEVMPTSVNFFLVRADDDERLIDFLLKRGMVVRHTRNFPGLDGKYIRIAARSRDENDRLVSAMRDYLSQ